MPASMSCPVDEALTLESELRLVRRMNGSAQSLLISDSCDRLWIVKLKSDLQGPNALANDLLGYHLCRAIDLPTTDAKHLAIAKDLFRDPQTWLVSESGHPKRPDAGIHFATRYFPDLGSTEAVDYLPPPLRTTLVNRTDCLGMFLFDVWASHKDRRQALFYRRGNGMLVTFVDHGHLFGGPDWAGGECYVTGQPLERVGVEEYYSTDGVDVWLDKMQKLLPSAFEAAISQVPSHWYTSEIYLLQELYLARLSLLRTLVEDAIKSVQRKAPAMKAAELRIANEPIRVLTPRGQESWLW